MADLPEKINSEPTEPFISKALKWTAWPLSAVIGWWWINHEARNSLYDTLKHTDPFREVRQGSNGNSHTLQNGTDGNAVGGHWGRVRTITKQGFAEGVSIVKPLAEEHSRFDKETIPLFKKGGFNHTLDYLRGISRDEAIKAGMMGFGAATFTLGVMLTLAENQTLGTLLSRRRKEENKEAAK